MGSSWQDKKALLGAEHRNSDNKLTFQENRGQQQLFQEMTSYTHLGIYQKGICAKKL